MASVQMYRHSILDERVAPRRSPSVKQSSSRTGSLRTLSPQVRSPRTMSPRTVIPDLKPDDASALHFHDDNIGVAHAFEGGIPESDDEGAIGIAQTMDDDKPESPRDYSTSNVETAEDDTTTTDGEDAPEPVLTPEPVFDDAYLQSLDNAVPAFTLSADFDQKRGFAPSVASVSGTMSNFSKATSMSGNSSAMGNMPEFFNEATFQTVLSHPTIAHLLLDFGQSRLCGENLEFLTRVTRYNALLGEVAKSIYEIHKEFISTSAPSQINLREDLLVKTNNNMKASLATTLPAMESIFVDAQNDIERLVYTDVYPTFVRHQMSVSAAKALGGDRAKYAGLGDCFVLTDPTKADNPIVYASDGFVKVTGYQRNEIIPRNCRFLQNRHTDRSAVRRLKVAIDKRQETVELLLNHKKNGEPFWNLLYVAPLYDAHGKLIFFLGGQINCSTTIHNASDVLRILGQSKPVEETAVPGVASPQSVKPPRSRSILNAFRSDKRSSVVPRAPGMENTLLERIEDMSLGNQIDSFYTAYSNVRAHKSLFIHFRHK